MRREAYHDVLCRRNDEEHILASFSQKIQYEYYGGNRYVSIEGLVSEHFSETYQ